MHTSVADTSSSATYIATLIPIVNIHISRVTIERTTVHRKVMHEMHAGISCITLHEVAFVQCCKVN